MSLAWTHPSALVLLLLVPLYFWLLRGRSRALPLPRTEELRNLRSASAIAAAPEIARALVLVALVLALAAPVTSRPAGPVRAEGVPIILAVDISSSMLAQDFRPLDRISVARRTIARFIESRPADAIGLVAFAGEALTLVPPTLHRPILLNAVETLRPGLLEDGTAIGDGLAAAINRLRGPEEGERVVVLLSDGENNRGRVDPEAAALAAAALGIRVHTIGVGSNQVAPVPVGSGPAGFEYTELAVGLDEEVLRSIARATGGVYYRATDARALEGIYDEIDRLLPSLLEADPPLERRQWRGILLIGAALLLLTEWAIRGSRWGLVP